MNYNTLVDEVRELSLEEKLEMRTLLNRYLAEEERQTIEENYRESLGEVREGRLEFSNDVGRLRKMMES